MKKFNEASYRTPCGEAGYIVRFEDGNAILVVAYHGTHGDGDGFACEECPDRARCPIMEHEYFLEQHVCGWDEADSLLELWEYEPTLNESQELYELMKIV